MAWGRRHTSANTPAWSQDDYHAEFADKIREQITAGVAPWQKPCPPCLVSVNRPITSHIVHNYLIYRYLVQCVLT